MVAIGDALGLELRFDSTVTPEQLKREQAREKAKKLAALVQGTCGLERQGVDRAGLEAMVEQTTHDCRMTTSRRVGRVRCSEGLNPGFEVRLRELKSFFG